MYKDRSPTKKYIGQYLTKETRKKIKKYSGWFPACAQRVKSAPNHFATNLYTIGDGIKLKLQKKDQFLNKIITILKK